MLTLGYIRRSKKAEENTVSLEEQQSQIENYCVREGLTLISTVCHNGVSGGKRERWDDVHAAIAEHGIKALVYYHQDRMARDAAGLLDNLRILARGGVQVHEVGVGLVDITKPNTKLLTTVRAAMDEHYKEIIAEKTSHALARLKRQGKRYTHIPPLGYCYRDGSIVADPLEQVALRIIERCGAQRFGARRTRAELKRQGYSGRMSLGAVHKQLQSIKEKLPANYFAAV